MLTQQGQLSQAKRAFTTRRIPASAFECVLTHDQLNIRPLRSGDVALARVEKIGHHKRLELPDGRRARLFEGDEIILVLGPRYAPDQYEAETPVRLGPCQLAAAGGVAGTITNIHERILQPTELTLLGLIGSGNGEPLNVREFALPLNRASISIPTLAVVGTAMNSGKTTVAASLVHGLALAGLRVGAAKITGTGAGGDCWHYLDAGAAKVVDFVDAGFVATYKEQLPTLELITAALLDDLSKHGCDIAIIEISDGLAQRETSLLMQGDFMRELAPRTVFAAREAAGAAFGANWLRSNGYNVLGVSGLIARSPLAMREFESLDTARCFSIDELLSQDVALSIAYSSLPAFEIAS